MAGNTRSYGKLASEVYMARYGFKQLKPMKDATYHGVKKKWKLRRTRHINDYGGKHESYAMAGNNCGVVSETHGTFP